jgi:hypothetical protein
LHERQCRSGSVNATSHPNLTKQLFQRAISIENDDFFDSIGPKAECGQKLGDAVFAAKSAAWREVALSSYGDEGK